jgi:ABC-2 type transport system permease protein
MQNVTTMIQRELGAFFLSPIAYAVMVIFLFSSGLAFGLGTFQPGEEASLRMLLDPWMTLILLFVLPMLTMRLLAEEFRSGTIETLLTAPVTEAEIVAGKFLGALAAYAILLGTLLLYPLLLRTYGPLDPWLVICNYLGLILLGGLYIAVGLFFSACTKHQVIAVLISFALLALLTFASQGLAQWVEAGWFRVVLQQVSVRTHFHAFVRGLFDVNHVIFFLSTTALFLYLTVKRLEMRRWQ